MPRIIVMSDQSTDDGGTVTLDERVASADLHTERHSAELIQRLGWAVHDADDAEHCRAAR